MLLIYPKHSPFPHSVSAPLSIFCLGSYIEAKGGQVEYFDERIQGLDYLFKLLDKKPLLAGTGRISHAQMEKQVGAVYEQFDARRKTEQAIAADAQDMEELNDVAKTIKQKKLTRNKRDVE